MNQNFNWPPLESDPEIFTQYCHNLGLPSNFKFTELLTLDYEGVQEIPPRTYGVVLAYESGPTPLNPNQVNVKDSSFVNFYMKQTDVLDNACGVIACIHTIGNNIDNVNPSQNSILSQFFNSCVGKTPQERASILENSNEFKSVHSSFANLGQSEHCATQEEVKTHFVTFVSVNGNMYLLDGCMVGPYLIKENVSNEKLLDEAIVEIKNRLLNGNITENVNIMFFEKSENN
jgi:ubiquitin carboxyl-terminal hydrolase L3